MNTPKLGMCLLALGNLILAVGFFVQAPWATALWPWTRQPLDYVVLASFLAAGFGAVLWIGLTGEWGAMVGALLDVGYFNVTAAYWLWTKWYYSDDSAILARAVAFSVFSLVELGMLKMALKHPIRDVRPADRLLVGSYWVFTVVLLVSGVALLNQQPIWPWPLEQKSATLFGYLFVGSAAYFFHGLYRPTWHGMKGQLVAFLLYDLVLIQSYLHLGGNELGYHLNLWSLGIYIAVIAYSSCLAVWYLFLNPRTRGWAVQAA